LTLPSPRVDLPLQKTGIATAQNAAVGAWGQGTTLHAWV